MEELLVEGPSKRRQGGAQRGGTRQGKLVNFAPTGPGAELGRRQRRSALAQAVTVTAGHPHHLSGQLLQVTARPAAPRALIPRGQRLTQ